MKPSIIPSTPISTSSSNQYLYRYEITRPDQEPFDCFFENKEQVQRFEHHDLSNMGLPSGTKLRFFEYKNGEWVQDCFIYPDGSQHKISFVYWRSRSDWEKSQKTLNN